MRQPGHLHGVDPLLRDQERRQVGLGEIAIVVRLLLRAHRARLALLVVEQPRLLRDLAARLDHRHLAADLVLDRLAHEAERVDVLQLHAGAQLLRALLSHRHVGVAAERALLHVAVVDPEVHEREPQRLEVLGRLLCGAQVGLADDLDERRAGAVQVDLGASAAVHVLARVLFEMDAGQAYPSGPAFGQRNGHRAAAAEGRFVLADLIALGQVGIEVVLASEDRAVRDRAAERLARLDRHLHHLAVERRQGPGQAQADRAHLRVRRRAEGGGAGAEDLALGQELGVDFESDDRLVIGDGHVVRPPPRAGAACGRRRSRARARARAEAASPRPTAFQSVERRSAARPA